MDLMAFIKRGALGAVLVLTLSAGNCDKQGVNAKYALEHLPGDLRNCAKKLHVDVRDYETNGKILWKDAQRLLVAMTENRNALERCQTSTVKWIDAQHAALNRYLGQ